MGQCVEMWIHTFSRVLMRNELNQLQPEFDLSYCIPLSVTITVTPTRTFAHASTYYLQLIFVLLSILCKNIQQFLWPPRSLDFSPILYVWGMMERWLTRPLKPTYNACCILSRREMLYCRMIFATCTIIC